jgi:hypothetical protein
MMLVTRDKEIEYIEWHVDPVSRRVVEARRRTLAFVVLITALCSACVALLIGCASPGSVADVVHLASVGIFSPTWRSLLAMASIVFYGAAGSLTVICVGFWIYRGITAPLIGLGKRELMSLASLLRMLADLGDRK